MRTPSDHHPASPQRALQMALIGLLVGASLWVVIAGSMARTGFGPMLLPEGSAKIRALETASEPIPLPGGGGHIELPQDDARR